LCVPTAVLYLKIRSKPNLKRETFVKFIMSCTDPPLFYKMRTSPAASIDVEPTPTFRSSSSPTNRGDDEPAPKRVRMNNNHELQQEQANDGDDMMAMSPDKDDDGINGAIVDSAAATSSGDSYESIVNGPHGIVFNTWMPGDFSIRPATTIADSSNLNREDAPMNDVDAPCEEQIPYGSEVKTYTKQLLQVKRRLWPAAEECGRVCDRDPALEWAEARRACNPLELLGEGRAGGLNHLFMNRSAIKLANIDALLKRDLTSWETGGPFLFVDLCGAPGGFSEYIMYRCRTERKFPTCWGFGMSLIGPNEHGNGLNWKIHDKSINLHGFYTQYTVCLGEDGTGDLYNWNNTLALQQRIQQEINATATIPRTKKVNLVVADGGFDAQRDSECQEELAQKLVVCQVAAGLSLLETGGKLVVKMFGFQKSTTRAVMRSLHEAFQEITIFKPISSRPASSERYVVCRGFNGLAPGWDGPNWINNMLLGEEWCYRNVPMDSNLHELLNRFDRDLLALNLKACFAILSYMERKARAVAAGSEDPKQWCIEPPEVNVEMYKQAWYLQQSRI
jgi:23S rRNA U2552 (ribose-2'-O)-methylase RlmE/FtsJ